MIRVPEGSRGIAFKDETVYTYGFAPEQYGVSLYFNRRAILFRIDPVINIVKLDKMLDLNTILLLHGDQLTEECSLYQQTVKYFGDVSINEYGRFGHCYEFNEGFLYIDNFSDFDVTNFTIEAFIKPKNIIEPQIIFLYGHDNDDYGIQILLNPNLTLSLIIQDLVNNYFKIDSKHAINSRNWTHIAFCSKRGWYYIFINGFPSAVNVSEFIAAKKPTYSFYIGGSITEKNFLKAFLDEIRVSKVARWSDQFFIPDEEYGGPKEAQKCTTTDISYIGLAYQYNVYELLGLTKYFAVSSNKSIRCREDWGYAISAKLNSSNHIVDSFNRIYFFNEEGETTSVYRFSDDIADIYSVDDDQFWILFQRDNDIHLCFCSNLQVVATIKFENVTNVYGIYYATDTYAIVVVQTETSPVLLKVVYSDNNLDIEWSYIVASYRMLFDKVNDNRFVFIVKDPQDNITKLCTLESNFPDIVVYTASILQNSTYQKLCCVGQYIYLAIYDNDRSYILIINSDEIVNGSDSLDAKVLVIDLAKIKDMNIVGNKLEFIFEHNYESIFNEIDLPYDMGTHTTYPPSVFTIQPNTITLDKMTEDTLEVISDIVISNSENPELSFEDIRPYRFQTSKYVYQWL